MASALIYLVVVLVVAAVIFLTAAIVFGRGEQLAPLPPGATPTKLPAADIRPEDVRALRFQVVLRGYKATEVDWALERLAGEVEDLHGHVAQLSQQLEAERERAATSAPTGAGTDRAEGATPESEETPEPEEAAETRDEEG